MSDITTNYGYQTDRMTPIELPGAQFIEAVGRAGYGVVRVANLLTESTGTAAEIGVTLGTAASDHYLCHTLETEGALVEIKRWSDGDTQVFVAADTADRAEAVLADLTARMDARVMDVDSGRMSCTWWYQTALGPGALHGSVERLPWDSIAGNYTASVRPSLGSLCAMSEPPGDSGKIVLLHGAPGTGKSRMLQALGDAWSPWADMHVITDAQRFFAQPDYIYDVAARLMRAERWAVLVAEDCDSLVDGHHKGGARQNPGLSALLNLADGLMGQGMPFVFVLSTNLKVDRFDPAIVRPGRCLANIAVPPFSPTEAQSWLASHGVDGPAPEKGATLADLYAAVNDSPIAASGLSRGVTMPPILRPRARITRVIESEPLIASGRSIAASGRVVALNPYPVEPPKDWFARREFNQATPIVVTAEGQIYGHACDWQTVHTATSSYGRKALRAPRCTERNLRFMNRSTLCDDGSVVATGPIYMDCSHTIMSMPGAMVQDAMAHSGMAIADVAVFDDDHGLQIAGAVRPTATRLQVRVLRGNSDLSPHWAPASHFGHRGGGHVLLGLVAVNESGLPVRGIAASGYPSHPWVQWNATTDEPQTMVAVGVVHRRPSALAQVQAQLAAHDSILGEVVADRSMRDASARAAAVASRS